MRNYTIKGYLEKYIVELSGVQTQSISKLALYIDEYPRLLEPLAVYAVLSGASEKVCRKHDCLYRECCKIKECKQHFSTISKDYEKLYNSYQYACNRQTRINDTKYLLRKKIIELQKTKNVSIYKIYNDLNIDKRNLYCCINSEDLDRVNIKTMEKIWKYLEEQD